MKVTLEEERTNEKPMLRNKLEDLQSQVEELNTRFKQDRKQRAFMFIFMILFGLMFMWLALDMRAIRDLNISTSQKIGKIEDNFQKNAKYITDQPNSLKNINSLATFLVISIILAKFVY